MPLVQNVYRDQLLTNVSVKYTNPHFVADLIAPTLEVPKRSGYFFQYNKENLRAPTNDRRTGFAATNIVEHDLTQVPYGPLSERGLKEGITPDDLLMFSDPLDPRTDAAENVTEKMLLRREIDLFTDMSNTSIVTQNATLSGTGQWSDYVNSDPLVAIQGYISTMKKVSAGIIPNTLALSQPTWDQLKNHPKVIARLVYTTSDATDPSRFGALVGIPNVIIADSVQNTASEGLTDSLAYIWGKHAWLMYVAPTPGIKKLSAFYHLALKGARGVYRWMDNDPPIEWVAVRDYYDRKLMAAEAVYFIQNAVA